MSVFIVNCIFFTLLDLSFPLGIVGAQDFQLENIGVALDFTSFRMYLLILLSLPNTAAFILTYSSTSSCWKYLTLLYRSDFLLSRGILKEIIPVRFLA